MSHKDENLGLKAKNAELEANYKSISREAERAQRKIKDAEETTDDL